MNDTNTSDRIIQLICNAVAVEFSADDLSLKSTFFDDLNFDSIRIIQLLTLIESEFSIELDDEDIDFQVFASIKTLSSFVDEQLAEQT